MIFSDQFVEYSSKHPKYLNRSEIVINLIKAYNLFPSLVIYPADLHKSRFDGFIDQLVTFHKLIKYF